MPESPARAGSVAVSGSISGMTSTTEQAQQPTAETSGRRWALRNGVHLWVLWGFAVVQPTFDALSHNVARFFLLRGVEPVSLIVSIVGYAIVPPLLMLGAEALVRRFSARWAGRVHLFLVWALASLILLYALKQVFTVDGRAQGAVLVVGCWALGVAATVAYVRFTVPRLFLEILTPMPAVFVVLLLFFSPAEGLLFPGSAGDARADGGATAPVVVVIFDEFPDSSLLDAKGEIDARRYPNFARLARDVTWFPNATSAGSTTIESIPAILSGMKPREEDPDSEVLPTASDYPNSIFSLLAGSHDVKAMELYTQLCKPELCPLDESPVRRTVELASAISVGSAQVLVPKALNIRLPAIGSTWGESLEAQEVTNQVEPSEVRRSVARRYPAQSFERFIESIQPQEPEDRPGLYFLHVNLPHTPWRNLPSGQVYSTGPNAPDGRTAGFKWTDDRELLAEAVQRHLVQVQLTDRLVGKLIRRLRDLDLYDSSAIVLTSDHGGSLIPGNNHRKPNEENLADIALVPLFVKAPRQRTGRRDQRFVRTFDLVPTLADMLGVELPWEADGISWASPGDAAERPLSMTTYSGPMTRSMLLRQQRQTVRRNAALLGPAGRGPDLFTTRTRPRLLGRTLTELDPGRQSGVRAEIENPARLGSVSLDGGFLPALVEGRLVGGEPERQELAVAVNGRIWGSAKTTEDGEGFAALISPEAFRDGENRVDVLLVEPAGGTLRLTRLGGVGPEG